MDERRHDAVVSYAREAVGDPLRSVLAYERAGNAVEPEILYVRDDVRAEYPDGALDQAAQAVVDEVTLESISADWLEHLHRFGELHGTVRVFDTATVVHCWAGEDDGLSLGWDAGADVDVEPLVRGLHDRVAAEPAD